MDFVLLGSTDAWQLDLRVRGYMSLHWLYASRVLCGLSMGVVLMTLPHYVSEIADPEVRGSLACIQLLFVES